MTKQSLMELFSNPDTMHSLSFGDKMLGSTVTMLMGMGITFLVLCILWAFITVMGKVMNAVEKPKKEAAAPAPAAAQSATPSGAATVAADEDANLVAAIIAAAIAAYEGDAVQSDLVVKRIVRIPNNTTLWQETARNEHLDSRRF